GAIMRNAYVTSINRDSGSWCLDFDDAAREARSGWLVDATGRRAAVVRRLGAVRRRDVRLVAVYAVGRAGPTFQLNRTLIEATPDGWWYAARLPSGDAIAGFHTSPKEAVPLVRNPELWRQALAATGMVSSLLAGIIFDRVLGAAEAGGSQTDRVVGDGWVVCGDAAQAFDPISAQGIFSALLGGMRAADLVRSVLDGAPAGAEDYIDRLAQIREIYLTRRLCAYRSESRWPTARFWLDQCRGYGSR
ncbi:MAG: fad dependent oxidoreductase, partial [Isosphaeraceae bacterium]